jgi:hypothetical protein
MGMGYSSSGAQVRGFTGLSGGFWEGLGFAQNIEFALTDRLWLDLGARLASTESTFDGGGSLGFSYRMPTR